MPLSEIDQAIVQFWKPLWHDAILQASTYRLRTAAAGGRPQDGLEDVEKLLTALLTTRPRGKPDPTASDRR
jgi:hypothetical protein